MEQAPAAARFVRIEATLETLAGTMADVAGARNSVGGK